jgi:epoxyqueuosine reductase
VKEAIRQHALRLGFDACHFTSAERPASAARFQDWLELGWHGEMRYLERNALKRMDPHQVLPGAKTILALAASYHLGVPASSPREIKGVGVMAESGDWPISRGEDVGAPRNGVIARYARYPDYHQVLGERLKTLAVLIGELGGPTVRSLWYVDTGPLLERDLAQRAGLGFIGKHTNLISRQFGNWIFLAEILTTLGLEPDEAEQNRCGSCARCIAACPTAAIRGPFQLDARRCISYLTIELRGPIPVELRPLLGERIFGCDDCLEVCPWNRFAREGALMNRRARPDLADLNLLDLLKLNDTGFKRRFAGTPMIRAKRSGLLRNVCVALGNTGNEAALPELQRAAVGADELVAEHAQWAMGRIHERKCQTV